jgi:hypothetical protein
MIIIIPVGVPAGVMDQARVRYRRGWTGIRDLVLEVNKLYVVDEHAPREARLARIG